MFGAVLQPGDVMHHRMAGGGGHGNPLERDPLAVVRDVLDDKVSIAAARDVYGVVVDRDGELDLEATDALGGARCGERCRTAASCGRRHRAARPGRGRKGHGRFGRSGYPPPAPMRSSLSRNRHVSVTEVRQFVHRRSPARGRRGSAWRRAERTCPSVAPCSPPRAAIASRSCSGSSRRGRRRTRFGPALTVQGAPGDNLALHHAVSAAEPGEVIVLASAARPASRTAATSSRSRHASGAWQGSCSTAPSATARSSRRSACPCSTAAPRHAARRRQAPGRSACRSRSTASPSSRATSSAPTPTASRSSPAADAEAVLAAAAELEAARARDRRSARARRDDRRDPRPGRAP